MKHIGGDGAPMFIPIRSLGLSDELTDAALEHGYNTLHDFQEISLAELLAKPWFTASMFRELVHILKQLHKLIS